MGLPYDFQIDIWSLGCIIAELYCGVPLFPGCDENELLEFQLLFCGMPPQLMIDQGKKKNQFFNIQDGYKIIRSKDSRLVHMSKSSVSLPQVLFRGKGLEEFNTQEIEKLLSPEEKSFLDLVRRCLEIDPYKRISCEEAIRHDFFKEDLIREEELMEKEMMQKYAEENPAEANFFSDFYEQSPKVDSDDAKRERFSIQINRESKLDPRVQ